MSNRIMLTGIVFALLLTIGVAGDGWSQQEGTGAAPSATEEAADQEGAEGRTQVSGEVRTIQIDFSKIWALLQFWRWPLFACLIVGVIIVVVKAFRLTWDLVQASQLRKTPLHRLKIDEIRQLVTRHSKGSMSGLLDTLVHVHQTSHTLEALAAEIQLFRQAMDDRTQSVRHWLGYLSAAAGALGLLGTVWGMFTTFYGKGGEIEHTSAVLGMGIALVTTGVGITISLIIDMGSTIVQTIGNRSLDISMQKAEEFREAFLRDIDSSQRGAR